MINAKQELLTELEGTAKIKCASVSYDGYPVQIVLKTNYSQQDYKDFLSLLDFNYNNGYGTQHVDGTVWLNDDTWLSRGEYDGSEWWQHNVMPDIPTECL